MSGFFTKIGQSFSHPFSRSAVQSRDTHPASPLSATFDSHSSQQLTAHTSTSVTSNSYTKYSLPRNETLTGEPNLSEFGEQKVKQEFR